MDNFQIDITCAERAMFDHAIEIGFTQDSLGRPKRATHFVLHPEHGFIFLWGDGDNLRDEPNAQSLPFPTGWEQAAEMAWEWLTEHAEKPPYDHNDSDVSETPGWRVYTDFRGHVGHYHYAIVAVKPAWAWHGK